jgi:hypothetical protein
VISDGIQIQAQPVAEIWSGQVAGAIITDESGISIQDEGGNDLVTG